MATQNFVVTYWKGPYATESDKGLYVVVDNSTGKPGERRIECGFDTEGEAKIYLQERQRGCIHADAQRSAWDSVKHK